ncbi:ABC transporter ATP-binding protein [Chryseobacterium sp. MYb264]|uniref:ABC transporter ATP-binding protein n=1 Tax=Chryseobacterium sp. MYb264 TaxID=2745153 RepID=UPI002E0E887C|nr:ABC transporter ATP-binding protein [Chryseobacterium sp. MYb264]
MYCTTHHLSDILLDDWRKITASVPQNSQLFNGTVLQNIVLEEEGDDQKLQELVLLGFDNFINSLPQGFMTVVGEEGINLSGGQKQLLSWMRALYHNPEFIILDEPTSSLDVANKAFIYELIIKVKKNKIIFMITHNLENIKNICDEVVVLKDSSLVKY